MSLEKSIIIDSIIFLSTNIYIILWILRKKLNLKEKLSYILFFTILNSSYNIMIKPIHDYNMLIPRTFIWRYKIVGSFSLMDILFLLLFILFIKDNILLFLKNTIVRLIYFREFIIIILGSMMFFYNKGYWLDGGSSYIITMKGIVYFFPTVVLSIKYMKRDIKDINYIKIFCIILITGMISTFFIDDYYLWVRYGNAIKIIDQEDAYGISMFAILYLLFYMKERKNLKSIVLFFVMLLQNLLCMYKANLLNFIFALLIIYILFLKKTKKQFIIAYLMQFPIGVYMIINLDKIKSMIFSQAISTRINQGLDFFNEMFIKGIFTVLFGLGIGTPYRSTFNIGDGGEIKAIDKAILDTGYRNVVQIPSIGLIKSIGIIGWVLVIVSSLKVIFYLKKVINKYKKKLSSEFKCLVIMITITMFTSTIELAVTGTSPAAILSGFIFGRLILEIKNINLYNS